MTSPYESGSPTPDGRAPGEADDAGNIFWPGDEEAHRAPGSALVLLVLSFVAGGLYVWAFWPLMAGFDWIAAITLKSSILAVLGGVIMWFGGVLFIRHGLIWASRLGAILAALPMTRLLIDSIANTGGANLGEASLEFFLQAGPALLVLVLTFLPVLTRWRIKRQQTVAAQAKKGSPPRRVNPAS